MVVIQRTSRIKNLLIFIKEENLQYKMGKTEGKIKIFCSIEDELKYQIPSFFNFLKNLGGITIYHAGLIILSFETCLDLVLILYLE